MGGAIRAGAGKRFRDLAAHGGAEVAAFSDDFVLQTLEQRRVAAKAQTVAAYLDLLRDDPVEAGACFKSLHVGYSAFFRDPLTFAALEKMILPGLLAARVRGGGTELRIWSAACAGGEEPYSLAMLLDGLCAARGLDLSYRIIATDICDEAIARARRGSYAAAALANLPHKHVEEHFRRRGDAWVLAPRIKGRVDFATYDLLDRSTTSPPSSIYGGFDLSLCCNLLLYYGAEARLTILAKLRRSLRPGGYLVTDGAERGIVEQAGDFSTVSLSAAVFQAR